MSEGITKIVRMTEERPGEQSLGQVRARLILHVPLSEPTGSYLEAMDEATSLAQTKVPALGAGVTRWRTRTERRGQTVVHTTELDFGPYHVGGPHLQHSVSELRGRAARLFTGLGWDVTTVSHL